MSPRSRFGRGGAHSRRLEALRTRSPVRGRCGPRPTGVHVFARGRRLCGHRRAGDDGSNSWPRLTLRTDRRPPPARTSAAAVSSRPSASAGDGACPAATCGLPAFAPAAVWRASDGDTPSCAAGPDGRLCATGLDADRRSIEEIRRQLRLVGAGTCACRPSDATRLDGMTIDAITPAEDPWPLSTWALGANGDIAGFRRELAIRYDPATGRTLRTRIDGINAAVRRSVRPAQTETFSDGRPGLQYRRSPSATYAYYRFTTLAPIRDSCAPDAGHARGLRPHSVRHELPGARTDRCTCSGRRSEVADAHRRHLAVYLR